MKKLLINIIISLIWIYQNTVSKLLPSACKFYPSCSNYTSEAINKYGAKGFQMGIIRIFKCNPFTKSHGWDPVK